MHLDALHILQQSIDDHQLDKHEKHALYELLLTLNTDGKRYIRNQAFDLAQEQLRQGASQSHIIKWLERVAKLIDKSYDVSRINSQAFFSPGESCRDAITARLEQAHQRVDICVFTISDNVITDAILAAHQRDVAVRIITDNDKANDRGSDVYSMKEAGVATVMDSTRHHMHHKFALIDNCLINGSFNWTRSATEYNQENIVISDNQGLIEQFHHLFDRLWEKFD